MAINLDVRTEDVMMTEEQKFVFDLKGWLLLPSVLTEAEIDEDSSEIDEDSELDEHLREIIRKLPDPTPQPGGE